MLPAGQRRPHQTPQFRAKWTQSGHRAWLRSPRGWRLVVLIVKDEFLLRLHAMDGLMLAAAMRGRWPPIKIVAKSGFVSVGKDDLPEGSRFLQKPYRPEQIVATLRELTGGG